MGYRYIGSKNKIIDDVIKRVGELVPKGSKVIDLMCGTGTVSAALKEKGFQVVASDLMTFSYHHARILLLLSESPKFKKASKYIMQNFPEDNFSLFPLTPYEKIIECINIAKPIKGYFWKEFSREGSPKDSDKPRNYFTPYNAKKIDGIRNVIINLRKDKIIGPIEHSLLLHDLIMAANDIANIAGTYGHYLSKTVKRAEQPIKLAPSVFRKNTSELKHKVYKGYAEKLSSKLEGDLCYIDPPYMKRQYAANYHILETLAREDFPDAVGVSGLRPWRDQYSNFCTKTKIRDSFHEIFTKIKCPKILISYSEDGLLSLEQLEELFSKYGALKTYRISNTRFKSNNSKLGKVITEYLLYIKKQ